VENPFGWRTAATNRSCGKLDLKCEDRDASFRFSTHIITRFKAVRESTDMSMQSKELSGDLNHRYIAEISTFIKLGHTTTYRHKKSGDNTHSAKLTLSIVSMGINVFLNEQINYIQLACDVKT
jgi:hypothetical protein